MWTMWLYFLLALVLSATPGARAEFGDPMDHGTDDLFESMGQATIAKFSIENGLVSLDVAFEDTEGQDEVWVLDFQDFSYRNNRSHWPVVQTNGGQLVAENTGTCSSVFSTVPYDATNGFYKDVFVPGPPGNKSLFTTYETLGAFVQKGSIKVREDHVKFDGPIDTLFDCEDSDGESVWDKKVTTDMIEFNTTLYMTNVRPQGSSANPPPSYVQSYVILYWRLLRVALSRFLISSTERLRPIFEYAIVSAVYINDNVDLGLDRERALVEIAFRTLTAHPNGSLISVFRRNQLTYDPADRLTNNKLSHIKKMPTWGCNIPLGIENSTILDDQLTGSSAWLSSSEYSANKGRLNAQPVDSISAGAWLAGTQDLNQWIQVDLLENKWVSGVQTQGHTGAFGSDLYVTKYQVSYSTEENVGLMVLANGTGTTYVFNANFDGQTVVTNHFDAPVLAKIIRILPQEWNTNIAMRIELLGCELHTECYVSPTGTDYRGTVSMTETGETCQRWSSQEPHTHSFSPEDDAQLGIGDHNFCRNPNSLARPWCYTNDPSVTTAFCNVGSTSVSCTTDMAAANPSNFFDDYAPYCNLTEWEGYCVQRWVFTVVLEVDSSLATNRMPIDATGEFSFEFDTYDCPNNDRSNCRRLDIPEAIVANELTLQSTVEVVDNTKDSPRVFLKKVHGSNPTIDIRDGVSPGVSHLEQVTIDTHFFPQFLRDNLEMELTLFMVCVGAEYNTGDGCLVAPTENSYTAYISPYFYYRLYTNPQDSSQFTDMYADDIASSAQTLDSHQYIHAIETHRTVFTNKALSAQSRQYTITSVFRLIERTQRRKRDIHRRDVEDKIDEPIAMSYTIFFSGCPPNSTHDARSRECVCINEGEEYSAVVFECKKLVQVTTEKDDHPTEMTKVPRDGESNLENGFSDGGCEFLHSSTWLLVVPSLFILALHYSC